MLLSRQERIRASAVATLAAAALVLVWAAPANAANGDSAAARAVEIANRAVNTVVGAEPDTAVVADDATGRTTAGELTVPDEADQAITMGSGGFEVGVSLPSSPHASDRDIVGDDAVFADGGTTFVVDALDDGFRITSVLASAEAPHVLRHDLSLPDHATPRPRTDGAISLVRSAGDNEADTVIGQFDPAWAVDASGAAVPTRYELDGDTLVQVVTPGPDAVYPIVADPTLRVCTPWGVSFGVCADLSRAETLAVASKYGVGGTAAAAAYFSETICGKLPTRFRGIPVRALCKSVIAYWAANVIRSALEAASRPNKCLTVILYAQGLPVHYLDPSRVRTC